MNEIKCPKCGEVFTIDEGLYAEIAEKVRKETIEEERKAKEEADRLEAERKAEERRIAAKKAAKKRCRSAPLFLFLSVRSGRGSARSRRCGSDPPCRRSA